MRLIIILLMSMMFLEAQSIKNLINYSLKRHLSLKTIEYKLSSMDEHIEKASLWKNPKASFGVNDIQFRKPFSRSEERMQNQSFAFEQSLPWFDKLDAQKNLQKKKKKIVFYSLEEAKVALAYNIRSTAYTIKELEERIKIVKKYALLEKQNISLYTDIISTDEMSHSNSMNAQLSLANIEIRIEKYKSMLKVQKEKLRYLVQKKVTYISNKLTIKKPKSLRYYLKRVKNNPSYHKKEASSSQAKANKKVKDLEHYPDPFVKVGYYNRVDFPNYTSINIGVSLPIYGKEKLNSQIAQKAILQAQSNSLDFVEFLKSKIRMNYARLNEAYRIYNIIQHKSLPQLKHLLELSASAIEEGADLFTYTNILEEQLKLEEEKITMKGEYLRSLAKLKSLIGVL